MAPQLATSRTKSGAHRRPCPGDLAVRCSGRQRTRPTVTCGGLARDVTILATLEDE